MFDDADAACSTCPFSVAEDEMLDSAAGGISLYNHHLKSSMAPFPRKDGRVWMLASTNRSAEAERSDSVSVKCRKYDFD